MRLVEDDDDEEFLECQLNILLNFDDDLGFDMAEFRHVLPTLLRSVLKPGTKVIIGRAGEDASIELEGVPYGFIVPRRDEPNPGEFVDLSKYLPK